MATFYDKIYRQPVGRKVIHLCDSICCWSRGGEQLAAYLQQKLGIAPGETTADGAFTLLPTCCLGACGEAPAMLVGTHHLRESDAGADRRDFREGTSRCYGWVKPVSSPWSVAKNATA